MKRTPLANRLNKTLRKLNALNILLITAFAGLVYSSYGILSSPYDPSSLKGLEPKISNPQKSLPPRPPSSDFASFNSVPAKNLFRAERSEYVKPKEISAAPPPPPPKPERRLPAPNLTLDGVLVSDETDKTALISGNFFTPGARVNLKQQRYKEGDVLGDYKIDEIDRRAVILVNTKSGEKLTLSLKFTGFKAGLAQRGRRPPTATRPLVPQHAQRVRSIRKPGIPGVPPPPPRPISPERFGVDKRGRGRQSIPAVYSGGRVYYPEHGSPPPQNISGAISPLNQKNPSGN